MGKRIIFFCTLPTHCAGSGLLYCATAESHCRATAPAVTPAPPAEGMHASVGTYTLGQSVRENSALFFYKGTLGCSFFACGWRPTVGGGRGHSNISAAGPCTFYLHCFLGTLRDFITNVCRCAHLRMCLLRCIYASLFALTRLFSEPLSIFLPLLCSQAESSGVDSKVNRSTFFCDAQ